MKIITITVSSSAPAPALSVSRSMSEQEFVSYRSPAFVLHAITARLRLNLERKLYNYAKKQANPRPPKKARRRR